MAFDDTAAGMSTLTDPNNAAPPAIGPAAPATTPALLSGGQDQLGVIAPPISGGGMLPYTGRGVSPSMRDQLAAHIGKTSNDLMASNPNPDAPMGWAKSWVAGAQSALAGLSAIKPLPEHEQSKLGAAFYQLGNVAKANQEQQEQRQARADKLKQQKIENQREDKRVAMEQESHDMAIMMNKLAIGKAISTADREQSDELYNNIYAPWAKDEKENKGASLIQEKLTQQGLLDLAKQHEGPDDPGGQKWLSKQDVRQDGWQTVTDANGDPVPEKDARGNLTGHNLRKQTFGVYTYGEPGPVTDQLSADAKKYLDKNIPAGTTMDPRDAALLRVQIGKAQVDENSANALALQAGKTKEELAELESKADYRAAGTAFTPWLIDAKGDAGLALKNMELHANEVGPDGKPTPQAQEAAKQYDLVNKGMGPEIIKDAMTKFDKEEEATVAAAAKSANAGDKDKAAGNTDLTGSAYLASIKDGSRRALVNDIGTGRIPPSRMEYMLARNPGMMQDVALAFPDIDAAKFPAYIQASKEFTTGSKIANQLNSANTSLVHMKALFDDNNLPGAFVGGVNYAKRQADLNDASLELARFLTGGTAPSNSDIEGAKASLDPSVFRTTDPYASKQEAVKTQVERINEKINQYREQWAGALPSPTWKRPMPGDSPEAQAASQYIANDGKPPVAGAGGAQPQTFTVPIPGPGNQVAHFATQAQADKFQAELTRQLQGLNNAR